MRVSSDDEAGPVEWGASFGRFGSDSTNNARESAPSSRRSTPKGEGSTRSASSPFGAARSSFGTKGANGGSRASRMKAASRPKTSNRGFASSDDPFGPVVGASADAPGRGDDLPGVFPEHTAASGHQSAGGGQAEMLDSGGSAATDAGKSSRGRRSGGRAERRGSGGRGGPNRSAVSTDDAADGRGRARSDEEWVSEARSILLRQLALGPRSRHQLDQKLAERDVPLSVATALLDRFEEVQLIDDAEFARMWVRTRTAARSLSRSSLRRELADKGIEQDLAEDALLQISDDDESEQARNVVRRKLRGSVDLSDRAVREKEVRRLVGVLARKGYSPGAAFSIVRSVLAETETAGGPA